MGFSSIEDVIKDASKGKIFILVDDENRENEGDLCVLGEFASPDAINFMAKFCSISKNIDWSLNALFGNTKKVIKNRMKLIVTPNKKIIFVETKQQKN